MIRIYSLLLGLFFLMTGVILCGLLTNWFRYVLSLEGIIVVVATLIAVTIVISVSYVSYIRNSAEFLGASVLVAVISVVLVLLVYNKTIGGFPHFYLYHVEKSPPAVVQTQQGSFEYWIEIKNPFSNQHAEFLVINTGKEQKIPIQIFVDPVTGYVSATKSSDWAILSATSDQNVVILTTGPFLSQPTQQFRIDLSTNTVAKLPKNAKE